MPTILEIQPLSPGTFVRVRFDEPLLGNPSYLDPDNYVFSGGLETIGVVLTAPDAVVVLTSQQETDHFYTMEFNPNV